VTFDKRRPGERKKAPRLLSRKRGFLAIQRILFELELITLPLEPLIRSIQRVAGSSVRSHREKTLEPVMECVHVRIMPKASTI
jgi:hypothetical protein